MPEKKSETTDARELMSDRLKKLLVERNINQRELAEAIDVSESTIGKWILKKAMPRMGAIQNMAKYFNVSKMYFLDPDRTGKRIAPPLPYVKAGGARDLQKELREVLFGLKSDPVVLSGGKAMTKGQREIMLSAVENTLKIAEQITK